MSTAAGHIEEQMETIGDVASRTVFVRRGATAKEKADAKPVNYGIRPQRITADRGLVTITPGQALTVWVPRLNVNGDIQGYQRSTDARHAKKIADHLGAGGIVPPVSLAANDDGSYEVIDGQHRLLACVIAKTPIEAVISSVDESQRRSLFSGQRQAKTVDRSILVLNGTSPIERYVQDAFTNPSNPWNSVVGMHSPYISANVLMQLLTTYCGNTIGTLLHGTNTAHIAGKTVSTALNSELAAELHNLVVVFGAPTKNHVAYRSAFLRALTGLAVLAIRDSDRKSDDIRRWHRHMPTLNPSDVIGGTTKETYFRALVQHWNKRLTPDRRIHW